MKIKIYLLAISFNLFAIGFDAIEIYTTNMTIEQQVENIYNKIKQCIIE